MAQDLAKVISSEDELRATFQEYEITSESFEEASVFDQLVKQLLELKTAQPVVGVKPKKRVTVTVAQAPTSQEGKPKREANAYGKFMALVTAASKGNDTTVSTRDAPIMTKTVTDRWPQYEEVLTPFMDKEEVSLVEVVEAIQTVDSSLKPISMTALIWAILSDQHRKSKTSSTGTATTTKAKGTRKRTSYQNFMSMVAAAAKEPSEHSELAVTLGDEPRYNNKGGVPSASQKHWDSLTEDQQAGLLGSEVSLSTAIDKLKECGTGDNNMKLAGMLWGLMTDASKESYKP